ncbi:MMPL family transporter [Helicobacter saguini]|uniref:MMPL family transporter n=1 Tax=Helicobacter saguini TaxID=1548018 RepID=A0A347W676_9HELI|nr:efflux RND transporter permease subunit [Helicobacter saguini]MWV61125.1 MMPL family transporter [Helicobacter saguini]MWV68206.1 MMPL family transporter [Helicobacter saguini]MWV70330.1 MMPL family transporter [Helicobacter saguini]MWV72232.1 MMPL family transporter [Helicobacter saguini]TLD95280.1 multidrug efflux RND transporter permease subunit [Helicobacter saguini]
MLSKFFINRPALSAVLSIVIVIAGLLCMDNLPIEQYPKVTPPQVMVRVSYPGASAETMSNSVISVLESSINGVEDMIYMQSSANSSGESTINIFFKQDANPDMAVVNVNNRVQAVINQLPAEVQRLGVNVRKQSTAVVGFYQFYSKNPAHNQLFIANYILLNIIDEVNRISGVGDVQLWSLQNYAMRIWLNPAALQNYNLSPLEVINKIQQQNAQFAPGKFGAEPINASTFTYTITTKGLFNKPEEFENIIIRANADGSTLRLKDVAKVTLGAQDYVTENFYNDIPSVPIRVSLQPGANILEVSNAVDKAIESIAAKFPDGISYEKTFRPTEFITKSIAEVKKTFFEAIILVVLVIYLFLGSFRATIIPVIAIPVSIIGTFVGLYFLGFSINLLTLFGLILAIGIVVDDAIIVIENVERIMAERGCSAKEATIESMKEISGAVVAIVLVISAVFLPVTFMSGFSGEIYKQFAVTITISVIISGCVALSLTPALCAMFLKPHKSENHNVIASDSEAIHTQENQVDCHENSTNFLAMTNKILSLPNRFIITPFNKFFDWLTIRFTNQVRTAIKRGLLMLILLAIILGATYQLFQKTPRGLVPSEDMGFVFIHTILPEGASLNRTIDVQKELIQTLLKKPYFENLTTITGYSFLAQGFKTNAGIGFHRLIDWDLRKDPKLSDRALIAELREELSGNPKANFVLSQAPTIIGLDSSGVNIFIQSKDGGSLSDLKKYTDLLIAKAKERPEIANIVTSFAADTPQYEVSLNREMAESLNVNINDVFSTMQIAFGSYYVNNFEAFNRTFRVIAQADSNYRSNPENLNDIFVKSQSGFVNGVFTDGNLVPLSSLLHFERKIGAEIVNRFNQFPAAQVIGYNAQGYSSGDAIRALEEVAAEVLPSGYDISYFGATYQEKVSSSSGSVAFLFGLLFVFLILVAQYEKWLMPLAVLTAVPFGVFGAILFTYLRGIENDIFFQVGLLVLIALSAKNAILIVEFAEQEKNKALEKWEDSQDISATFKGGSGGIISSQKYHSIESNSFQNGEFRVLDTFVNSPLRAGAAGSNGEISKVVSTLNSANLQNLNSKDSNKNIESNLSQDSNIESKNPIFNEDSKENIESNSPSIGRRAGDRQSRSEIKNVDSKTDSKDSNKNIESKSAYSPSLAEGAGGWVNNHDNKLDSINSQNLDSKDSNKNIESKNLSPTHHPIFNKDSKENIESKKVDSKNRKIDSKTMRKIIFNSAIKAVKMRFRPIVMTSLAFTLGVLPLAISSGAGALSRHAIATGVIGGMLAATFIAIFFIPLFYTYFARLSEWIKRKLNINI